MSGLMRVMFAFLGFVVLAVSGPVVADEAERFFPPGVWGKPGPNSTQAEEDQFYEEWFGNRLKREKEKPLWIHRAQTHAVLSIRVSIFRSAVIPDFSMIRVDVLPTGEMSYYQRDYGLCAVGQTSDVEGVGCQKRFVKRGRIDVERATKIEALVKKIAPFTTKIASQHGEIGMDGETTVFEFSGNGKFNAMQRWGLNNINGGPLAELAGMLAKL